MATTQDKYLRCPECGHMIGQNDALCLICGKKVTAKMRAKTSADRPSSRPAQPVGVPQTSSRKQARPEPAPGADALRGLFGTFFLAFTILFAFIYLFQFQVFLEIPKLMLMRGWVVPADRILQAYEFAALSRDFPDIRFRRRQIALELKTPSEDTYSTMGIRVQLLDSYQDARGRVYLQMQLINDNPLALPPVHNESFYLMDETGLYPASRGTPKVNLGPVALKAWSRVQGGITFDGLPEIRSRENPFQGFLVINNGLRYHRVPIKLGLVRSEPKSPTGWTLKEVPSGSN